jgi:hypothetical protein
MGEAGESKRDQAARALTNFLGTYSYHHSDAPRFVIDLIVDVAKEEIRAELAEQAEERRWCTLKAAVDGPADGPLGEKFWAEYWAAKAKREAAGKSTE